MTSEALRKARAYEKERLARIPPEALPAYHLTGGVGWINDPNGFSVYQGAYHLFFQYYPYDTVWGPMHWGHARTADLVRWERLPAAMAPDREYDRDGCFSGSALELPDGRHLLMYTGVRKDRTEDGGEKEVQTQCLAFGDGIDYEKYDGNPVIGAAQLPEGGSARDFRDPKLWREGDRYYAVAGNRCPDGSGAILLFESGDALHWQFRSVLAASQNERGRMWECPDFFSLDGSRVLLVSPQEMPAKGLEFIAGNVTLCLIGSFDGAKGRLVTEHEQTIDYGLDFYAPQTLLSTDGRRIMTAWMQYWNSVDRKPPELPFFGQMILPRELHVREGRLIQTPVRELERYRGALTEYRGVALGEPQELPGVRGRIIDMSLSVRPEPGEEPYSLFRLELAAGGGCVTTVTYRPEEGTVLVDRSRSGFGEDIVNTRRFSVTDRGGAIDLRVLLDRYSMEIFVNGGEQAASFTLYTPAEAEGIRFAAEGAARLDVEKYDLEFDKDEQAV